MGDQQLDLDGIGALIAEADQLQHAADRAVSAAREARERAQRAMRGLPPDRSAAFSHPEDRRPDHEQAAGHHLRRRRADRSDQRPG